MLHRRSPDSIPDGHNDAEEGMFQSVKLILFPHHRTVK